MVPWGLSNLPSVCRQHLLVEFSGLKTSCPHGIYMSMAPGDPTIWFGVMFIRKGPYASAILRFQISFPLSFPWLPPYVTFFTDMFHPLITPLTTYMYTTDNQVSGTVSAADDDERLPPGSFSLRHGFPAWFSIDSQKVEGKITTEKNCKLETGIYELLRYIRSTFDNEDILDQVPLHASGNPGAWYAWRTHRFRVGTFKMVAKTMDYVVESQKLDHEKEGTTPRNKTSTQTSQENILGLDGSGLLYTKTKKPGEWNWEGVWEVRVKKCIEASISESVLFGKEAADDLIHFLRLDSTEIDELKENIKRTVETLELSRRGLSEYTVVS